MERGQSVTGKAVLRGTPPAGSVLRIRFRDSYDRILRQQDFPVTPGQAEYTFEYQADAFATILMRVEALLIAGGEEVEMKDASFTVPKRRQGQFNFVQWDAPARRARLLRLAASPAGRHERLADRQHGRHAGPAAGAPGLRRFADPATARGSWTRRTPRAT